MTRRAFALVVAVFPATLTAGDQATPIASIPLKLGEDYGLHLSAHINGSEFPCGLDSGGGDLIYLDKRSAAAAGIQPTEKGRSANPQAATMATDERAKVTLEVGGLKVTNQTVLMQNTPDGAFACGIGLTVLQRYVVELSYYPPALRVYDASRYRYSGSGRAVPMINDQGSPFVTVTLTLRGADPIQARLAARGRSRRSSNSGTGDEIPRDSIPCFQEVPGAEISLPVPELDLHHFHHGLLAVDTGGGRPAGYLTKSFIDQHGVMSKVSKAVPDFWSGFAGDQPRVLATRLEKLSVGAIELPRPIFFLWQVRGFGGGAEPDGLLCPDFLRRFNLTFDYPHQQLILKPGPHFSDEMPFDASGTLIYREGQNPYRVLEVIDGSPAGEAGLKPGDIVLEFNGKPAGQLSNSEIADALTADGREYLIRVQRSHNVFTVRLKLRRLI